MFKNIKAKNIIRIVYIVIVFMIITSGTFSKYITSSQGSDSVSVATFYADVHDKDGNVFKLDLSDLVIGHDKEINFDIVNFIDFKSSDVTLEYQIKLVTTDNLPLTYKISKRTDTEPVLGTMINDSSFPTGGGTLTGGEMIYGESTTHKYTLTVSWDLDQKDAILTNEVDAVQLYITASQKVSGGI